MIRQKYLNIRVQNSYCNSIEIIPLSDSFSIFKSGQEIRLKTINHDSEIITNRIEHEHIDQVLEAFNKLIMDFLTNNESMLHLDCNAIVTSLIKEKNKHQKELNRVGQSLLNINKELYNKITD